MPSGNRGGEFTMAQSAVHHVFLCSQSFATQCRRSSTACLAVPVVPYLCQRNLKPFFTASICSSIKLRSSPPRSVSLRQLQNDDFAIKVSIIVAWHWAPSPFSVAELRGRHWTNTKARAIQTIALADSVAYTEQMDTAETRDSVPDLGCLPLLRLASAPGRKMAPKKLSQCNFFLLLAPRPLRFQSSGGLSFPSNELDSNIGLGRRKWSCSFLDATARRTSA